MPGKMDAKINTFTAVTSILRKKFMYASNSGGKLLLIFDIISILYDYELIKIFRTKIFISKRFELS